MSKAQPHSSATPNAWSAQKPLSSGSTTQAALLTPAHPAAIATIALRGEQAFEIIARAFRTGSGVAAHFEIDEARYGHWLMQQDGIPPEHVVLCRTGATEFEIHCHGGVAICNLILANLNDFGCEVCDGDQWTTDRHFMTEVPIGAAIEVAAESALPLATTLKVAAVLLDQASGSLSCELRNVQRLIQAARCEEARAVCEELLARGKLGVRLLEPWRVTLAGPTNAGKSSLINALVGASRVLVHHEPGTTRDAIDAAVVISSWPVVITDTAGLRASQETIEQQGIEIAWQRWQTADVGLLVTDSSVGWTEFHDQLVQQRAGPILIVLNKQDLQSAMEVPREVIGRLGGIQPGGGLMAVVSTRATQVNGTCDLLAALGEYFDGWYPGAGSGVPFLPEHVGLLQSVIGLLRDQNFAEAERLVADTLR